jgi:hypothetical protein
VVGNDAWVAGMAAARDELGEDTFGRAQLREQGLDIIEA